MDGSDEITITAPAGKFLEPGKFYYFVAFPQTLSQGVQLTMETFSEMGVFERRPSANGMSVKRSVFGNLRNIDQEVEFTKKTGPIPIEDPAFKTYLLRNHDADGDGEISYEEAESVREVILYPSNEYNLQSLAGIEYMPNLEKIDCHGESLGAGSKNDVIHSEHYYVGPYKDSWPDNWGPIGTLRYVDVSNNPNLKYLNINANSALGVEMGAINVSNCPLLTHIDVCFTWLEYPDVSSNTELDFIQFTHLRGTLPDFSRLTKVKALFIEWPQDKQVELVDLDVSHMPDLETLYVGGRIKSLSDLSANPRLRILYVWDFPQQPGLLNLSGCPDLEVLTVNYSKIQSLDVSQNTKLKELYCNGNSLTQLNLSNNTFLEKLECFDNPIINLTLPNSLNEIKCWNTHIGSIDVSSMENLQLLECANSDLISLDVRNSPKLWKLSINDNQIGSIDLSQNPLLQELAIWNCGLTTLDLSNNPELTWLRCWGNQIKILDVSHNTKLGTRSTYDNHDNGLSCAPMNDEQGNNVLSTLFITPNQTIPYVTENRSSNHIPAQTVIRTVTGGIPIEDPAFKNYLLQNYDVDGNGEISYQEAERIEGIGFLMTNRLNIQSLQGIEFMPNLRAINCGGDWYDANDKDSEAYNSPYSFKASPLYNTEGDFGPIGTLRHIDVSCNPELELLWLYNNPGLGVFQKKLDISHNPRLKVLSIGNTMLEYPDCSGLVCLEEYSVGSCRPLPLPDFSKMPNLLRLNIEYPVNESGRQIGPIFDVDVSHNPLLMELTVSAAALSLSDLSLNSQLRVFHCPHCNLGAMDLSVLPLLETLGVGDCGLSTLDISGLPELKVLYADWNHLSSLNLSNNDKLEHLNINYSSISSIDLSGLSSLGAFYCDDNPLTTLDVSHNTELRALGFSGTQITDIDVSNNKELTLIGCENIPGLTHLDLRQNTKLQKLYINGDGFTSIDITKNTELWDFGCRGNKISALNVSNNRLLKKLSCVQQNRPDGKNYLQTLYVSEGQSIPHITIDRNADYIPAETIITTAPQSGGGEGTGEEDW